MSAFGKHWIGGIVSLLALVGLCVWMTGWRTERMIESAYESCGSPDAIRMDDLKLSPNQRSAIGSLQASYRKAIVALCQRHCDEKLRLSKLLIASPRDDKAIESVSENVSRIEVESERLTTQHVLSMARAMDEKQAEIFLRKFSGEIVKSCPITFAPETR